jgi:hypothetical protein
MLGLLFVTYFPRIFFCDDCIQTPLLSTLKLASALEGMMSLLLALLLVWIVFMKGIAEEKLNKT